MQDRRATPQYLLLENNTPLSYSVRHFAPVLDSLTDHTWGLTVSLKDFTDVAITFNRPLPHAGKKGAGAAVVHKDLNHDYKEM